MTFDQELSESDQTEDIDTPLAERKLVTQSYDMSVNTLIEQWNDGTLVLPDIQREYVWQASKAGRLIESLLLNVPIPVVYFAEAGDLYEVIDGHQRISSIVRYVNNEFRLSGLKVLGDEAHRGKRFHELPVSDQRRIKTRVIRAIIITEESHPAMKFEVFERLNTGSISLNAQEIRNSTHRGKFIDLIKKLVDDGQFRACVGTRTPRRRMVDHELILRFFALSDRYEQYKPPLQKFLNDYCAEQNKKKGYGDELIRFERAVSGVKFLFQNSAFRLTDQSGALLEKSLNRALAETQMVAVSRIPESQLTVSREKLLREFGSLHQSERFLDTIQRATGDRSRTLGRIEMYLDACRRAGVDVDY
ncbi:DUF262 domain-containing protein [Streptomyces sp. SAS_269]|uniref:DUF262 domain-containing protein n=1 Tax=Streptomyces sp. SAS_269 TaxID=3412749 RepID=UPI00403C5D08